ncbi:MAG: PKD domain-containing protein [Chitinophagaceae bacterium]|nr:PKD domain-containing protein [Chitinophagaceae bacterium]
MKQLFLIVVLALVMLAGGRVIAQDFSNKGKDFWVAYGYHEVMVDGNNLQQMVLYFATEATTTVKVTIPGLGYSKTYSNIPANTVFTSDSIPKIGMQDARLLTESTAPENKGIHIEADHPVVAYAHIYNQSVSGATILFPTTTLGKEYYSVNYKNVSNTPNANCWFYVVACDTGTTTVQITPSAPTINHPAGVPFTVNMTQGQVYNVMGQLTNNTSMPYTGVDLTGSTIKSISTGTGSCKRIAVFSGSGRISITCNNAASSSDNYMVQAFPKSAWGKFYLTSPTGGVMFNNIFRICVADPTTAVSVNGAPIAAALQNNFYYELPVTASPQLIQSDKPILVVQYITSQGACGNGAQPGDPEVIYLSPVEQNISKVIWNATKNFQILQNYINVIIPNKGTAISSITLDGLPVPASSFYIHPQAPGYSYATLPVSTGQHIISSDSGFNAIAYGFGNAESYGYNAGTNVKDLYQFVSIANEYATVSYPATCKGAPFHLSMTFPYQPLQIRWDFGGLFPNDTISSPVYDSTWIINGKQLYLYKLTSPFTIIKSGTYPIKVFAQNPTPEGCSGDQEIDYDLQVYDPPKADFNFTTNGCATDSVFLKDASSLNGRTAIRWNWDFGDSGKDSVKNTRHKYLLQGTYNIKYSVITDVGCISDTASKILTITDPPVAKFSVIAPNCVGKPITFNDNSSPNPGGTIVKWYWNFGDGSPQVITTNNTALTHTYLGTGSFNATLKVETTTGCQSSTFVYPVTISPNPVANFSFPNICLPVGAAQFTDQSTISDGTQGLFSYSWNFGDASPNSTIKDPLHNYSGAGPYNVTLTVTSNNGCITDTSRAVNTIFPEPIAAFNAPSEICFGAALNFSDLSTVSGGTVSQWSWDFGDGTSSSSQNPVKNYSSPGTYTIKLSVTSAIGCPTVNNFSVKNIIIDPLPTVNFNFSSTTCENSIVTITDASIANAGNLNQWNWNYGDGTNAVLNSGNPFDHLYNASGIYNVSLQVQTDKGCTGNAVTKQLIIHPKPKAGFISPQVCLNDPAAPFTDTSHVAPGSITGWNWNFGDGGNSALQNPNHTYPATGTYTGTLIVTSDQGCKDTVAQSFTVNGSLPAASFTVQNPANLCSNQVVNLTDASSVNFGSLVRLEIYWDYGNDPTIKTTDNSPVNGKIYSHTYPEFYSPSTKTFTIQYVAYSGITCVSTVTQTVTLSATPELKFDSLREVCSNGPAFQISQVHLINSLPGSGTFSGPGTSPSGIFNPGTSGAGVQTIRYTYSGTNGCSNYIEQIIRVNPTPVANAGPDKVVLEGGFVTLTPAVYQGIAVAYSWTPATGLNNPNISNPAASPTEDITYTLTVTSDKGCTTSDQVYVEVLKKPSIPNIFSPNGDGIHDLWVIQYLSSYPGCTVDIYNRYGQLIFHSVGYNTPWDGTVNGKPVPVGTYYYIVDPKNGRSKMSGYVDVIR